MFEGFGLPSMERFGRTSWGMERFSPQVDIFERDNKLVVRADLPGMTKDDVTVDVAENALVIEGERKYEHQENEEPQADRDPNRRRRPKPRPDCCLIDVVADRCTAYPRCVNSSEDDDAGEQDEDVGEMSGGRGKRIFERGERRFSARIQMGSTSFSYVDTEHGKGSRSFLSSAEHFLSVGVS